VGAELVSGTAGADLSLHRQLGPCDRLLGECHISKAPREGARHEVSIHARIAGQRPSVVERCEVCDCFDLVACAVKSQAQGKKAPAGG